MAEVELKFDLPRRAHAAFARSPALPGAPKVSHLHAIYYDTPAFELRERRMALRLRRSGRRWAQCLKAGASGAGGLHAREEWEYPRPRAEFDWKLFADTPLAPDDELVARLAPIFEVDMRRTTWDVEVSPGNRVEVALDRGEVRCGEYAEAVSELEIESVAGDPMAVFELAGRLMEATPLHPSAVTKAQRGYRLARAVARQASDAPRQPVADPPAKARAVALDPAMPPVEAGRAIAREALGQLHANEAGVLAGEDIEFLHQYRVALRRLRSALRVFRKLLGPEVEALVEELRWLGALAGRARDWDVFLSETLPALLGAFGDARSAGKVEVRARERCLAAHRELDEALRSPRYARLLLALARWLASPAPPAQHAPEPLVDFAARAVRKRHKRLLADARGFDALDARERHALRLDAKRLRYALEGLAPLFRARRVRHHLEILSGLQDQLGRANDAAVAERLLAGLSPPGSLAQFARGWFAASARTGALGLEQHVRRLETVRRPKPAA